MSDITQLLERWGSGDVEAFDELIPVVYTELRRLARHFLVDERSGHTLQPTALVHEAYLRLSGIEHARFANRAHFFGAAAETMRRVLVDHARAKNAMKRGGKTERPAPLTVDIAIERRIEIVALNDALDALIQIAPEKARIVELRFFGGLSVDETAEFLRIAPVTVKRHWRFARAWLCRELDEASPSVRES